jgi:hypothetical protein
MGYGVGVALAEAVGEGVAVGFKVGLGVVFFVGIGVSVGVSVPVGGVGVGVTKIIFIALVSSGMGDMIFFPETIIPTITATITRNPIMRVMAASVFLLSSIASL